MEVSLVALLARLHDEWKEKISADEEAQQVRMEHNLIWIVWFLSLSASKGVSRSITQVRKELADQREKVKGIREELAREKIKLAQATVETMGEVEAFKPPGA